MSPIIRFAGAVALFLAAIAVAAQEPQFPIESIRVAGVRFGSEAVVITESRLVEGRSYSEQQIRDAASRVRRLPFVLDVDVALEKGTARGTYVLVFRVIEMKPVFGTYQSFFQTIEGQARDFRVHSIFENVGGRYFYGSRTMFAASADVEGTERLVKGDNIYSLGVTRYDLFGTRASIAALVRYREYSYDLSNVPDLGGRTTTSFGDHLIWDIGAAVPIAQNQALRASWHREERPVDVNPEGPDLIVRQASIGTSLAWVYDTTDDLFFPTSGTYATATEQFSRGYRLVPTDSFSDVRAEHYWRHLFDASFTKYWDVTPRQSLVAGLTAQQTPDAHLGQITGRAGYSVSLWSSHSPGVGEVRFEAEAQPMWSKSGNSAAVHGGVAFRNVWGTARLDFSYVSRRYGGQ